MAQASAVSFVMDADRLDVLRRDYDVIPIVRRLNADTLTPVSAFATLSTFSSEAFLLESVERGENLGRYSFVGVDARRSFTIQRTERDPLGKLHGQLKPLRVYGEESLPPFSGGAVGYLGYGAARWTEELPDRHEDDYELPDAHMLVFDRVLVFDHLQQHLFVISNLLSSDSRPSAALLRDAYSHIDETIEKLRNSKPDLQEVPGHCDESRFDSSCTRSQFIQMVEKAREQIAAGEIFQIVLSQRWSTDFPTSASLMLYRALRTVNPSPYMFLLRTKEASLVGSSPEMLVRAAGGKAETRPIAGTRPRGGSPQIDAEMEQELRSDKKENSEHLMLVDLGRNDLGRVSKRGSVTVDSFAKVERYSHVMHLVSEVRGTLKDEVSPVDALISCFPAGTVSGAPKIRAMQLIDELEPTRRGPYAGAIAYIGFSGNVDSCIAIRTVLLKSDRAWIQAGAGIVYDSEPEKEFEETVSKSAALRKAISLANELIRLRVEWLARGAEVDD